MKKIIDFVKESFAELKKVSWPSREDVASQTVVVVVSLIIVSMLLTVIDFLSLEAISKIITLGM
ncbi:MAG TPA: preprotein translocase subunit SecE [Spirochaetota bacterium]|nr:preprotein translocase subunit SecE [Spirochaetota bacterium]HOS33999.1 preprotein translocase subunit SecE [Spirochaetota bacterium]HOS55081.1 preprotein translocase subunit SecE [Spirochaetota bacterium]HPK61238.1 preprotein translocase subunit SecE [Spirochaetota bacterium]HQF77679.1 preprotein translocase subunit SecE [Spirochaetota bacterium]